MTTTQILTLMLALSGALNIAFAAGITARASGLPVPASILVAGGAAGGALTIFFTALPSYL